MSLYIRILNVVVLIGYVCMQFCSCQSKSDMEVRLEKIDSEIICHNPDSVLIILSSILPNELSSDRAIALHTLFLELAKYKTHEDLSDDRLITQAYHYFRKHGEKRYAMMSMFLKAEIQYEENDFSHSVISAMRAEGMAKELNDNYYLGRIYDLLSDINYHTYNFGEDIKYSIMACDNFRLADSMAQYYFALTELAASYSNNGMPERSIELLDSISSLKPLNHYNDYNLNAYRQGCYVMPFLRLKKYNQIDSIVSEMEGYSDFEYSLYVYSLIIEAYSVQGRFAEADKLISDCYARFPEDIESEISFQDAMYEYYMAKGDYKNAIIHQDNVLRINNERINDALEQTVAIAQRDYQDLQRRRYETMSHRLRNLIIIICIAAIVSGAWAILFFRERIRRKNSEINGYVVDIQRLSEDVLNESRRSEQLNAQLNEKERDIGELSLRIDAGSEQLSSLREQVNELWGSRFAVLNSLCDEYFAVRDTPKQRTMLYNKLKSEIQLLCSEESVAEIERLVDRCMDGIVSKLREQLPKFKPVDITILSLIFANCSPRTICLIIDKDLGYYYNKRKRLKDRIAQSDVPDKELFLEKIGG